jgi:protein-disulfide isomerase
MHMLKSLFLNLLTFGPFLTLGTLALAATGNGAQSSSDTVLVEVDGTKLTIADYERKNPSGFFAARNTFYETQRKAVEQYIEEYLLERQAQKEGVTVEQLLKTHINSSMPKDPSEETLRVFYEGANVNEPYEAVRDQVLQALRQRRLTKARAAYIQSLRSQANIALRIAPPRVPVDLKNTPVHGLPNAPVVLVEYADYECPYCQQIQPALDKLQAEYKDKLTFAYKDTPLPNHANAQKASEAAQCAGLQGKYWEYHDRLYATKQLALPQLKEHARELKLDSKAFNQCLDSGERTALVKEGMVEATGLGMQGTPSFMINGRFFGGGSSYDDLHRIIEEELGHAPAKQTDTASR